MGRCRGSSSTEPAALHPWPRQDQEVPGLPDWLADTGGGEDGVPQNQERAYIGSNAGPELTIFFEKEVRAKFESWDANPAVGSREAQVANTYKELITKSKAELLAMVNRDRAVIDLIKMSQIPARSREG